MEIGQIFSSLLSTPNLNYKGHMGIKIFIAIALFSHLLIPRYYITAKNKWCQKMEKKLLKLRNHIRF